LLIALVSPVDNLSRDLMVIHMVQHMLLLDLMPVLLILSLTKGLMRPVTRRVMVLEQRAGVFAQPTFAVLMYVGMMGLWHVPALYDYALAHADIHVLEHLCFSVAGFLYWWHLLSPIRGRKHLSGMETIVYMSVTKFFVGVLGIVLTFSTHSLYPWYQDHPHYWGLSARVDQNLAGVFMALEQSIIMGITLVYLVVKMLSEGEKRGPKEDQYATAMAAYRTALAAQQTTPVD
jgi:cytochrome c oxidase assembly factor CtaG